MALKFEHLAGFMLGVGVTAISFAIYVGSQGGLTAFVRRFAGQSDPKRKPSQESQSLDELILEKERLEDVIAERELAARQD